MTAGTIDVRYHLCIGCRACETACSEKKAGALWPAVARIHIEQAGPGPLDIPVVCHRCSDHPCVGACPPRIRALDYDRETGVVMVDEGKCIGARCGRCARTCPASAITFQPVSRMPLFCDLCGGEPACVQACAPEAITYLPGSSFDGRHYARPPEQIAAGLAVGLYGGRSVS